MARPRKWRKVCCLPEQDRFGPLNNPIDQDCFVTMTIDEYETIRLIDLEGFNQEKQGLEESNEPLSPADICDLVQALVQEGVDKKTAIKKIAVKLNLSRRDVYQTMLEAEKKEDIN